MDAGRANPLQYAAHERDSDIRANLVAVQERIARRGHAGPGRREDAVLLVAVSKTIDVERVRAAVAAGVPALGENRVQEAREKIAALGRPRPWHLIRHLQTSKVKDALECLRPDPLGRSTAAGRGARAPGGEAGRRIEVLAQVNVGEEPQKAQVPHGRAPRRAGDHGGAARPPAARGS